MNRITELEGEKLVLSREIVRLKNKNKRSHGTESMDSKFIKEMKDIFESQRLNAKELLEHSMANFDSLCYLVSLEHDLKHLECFPDQLPCQNNQLVLQKMVFSKKINQPEVFQCLTLIKNPINRSGRILSIKYRKRTKIVNMTWSFVIG